VIGRKNWLFSGSPEGAAASCVVYSLFETAKANSLNPFGYMKMVLLGVGRQWARNRLGQISCLGLFPRKKSENLGVYRPKN
jgi:hypothetical protein